MSESKSWSESDDPAEGSDTPPVAEQMRQATRALRAHLSLVRNPADEGTAPVS